MGWEASKGECSSIEVCGVPESFAKVAILMFTKVLSEGRNIYKKTVSLDK